MPTRSAFFREQQLMARGQPIENALEAAMQAVNNAATLANLPQAQANNANPPDPHRVVTTQRQSIFTRCNEQGGGNIPIGAKKIGNTGWLLYWKDSGITKHLLMVGKYAMQAGTMGLQDWFVWTFTPTETQALAGNWNPPGGLNNHVDMQNNGNLIYSHNDKHFGAQPAEAQYTIGNNVAQRKHIVAGMEAKAINHGMVFAGEAFFRFNVVVGTDGTAQQNTTMSIRVDTPGRPAQHSHPIPESAAGMVSHDTKVKSAIRTHTVNRDLDALVGLAKYLTLIGTNANTYTNLRADAAQYGANRPPDCVYWQW